ncbi:MAG: hypothetical protein KDK51_09920 [Deltaproteobacteria bacterium]|nr:hypothetical protein [Deltaproteobacteria bacterium]
MYFLNQGKYPWDSGIYEGNQYINPYNRWTGRDQRHPKQDKYTYKQWVSYINETNSQLLLEGWNYEGLDIAKKDMQVLVNHSLFRKTFALIPGYESMPRHNNQQSRTIVLSPHEGVVMAKQ